MPILTDLNLLRVLDVMLEERSVTRAGARLGLTQSAVSHALNRLRYALDDELFVRGPSGMQPTARAVEMGSQVHAALNQLQAALSPADFDPTTSDRRFSMVAGSYACAILAPPLVSRLFERAPLAELAISEYTADVIERLDARRLDFMLAGVSSAPERFARETIATEEMVWVVRAGHSLDRNRPVELEDLVSVPHVVVSRDLPGLGENSFETRNLVTKASWIDGGALDTALGARGLARRVAVMAPDTNSALSMVSRTDMTALAPRRLAQLAAEAGRLRLIEPPYASPPMQVNLLYLRDRLAEPAIAWMRDLIREAAASI